MRKGFTLAETLVTITIAVAILSTALMIFNFSNRSRGVTATARALQTALLVQEQFQDDLGRLLPGASMPVLVRPDQPSRISFYSYDPRASAPGKVVMRPVVYALDPATGHVTREWNQQRSPVGVAPLKSLTFTPFLSPTGPLLRVSMVVGREKGEPDGPPTVHAFLARIPTGAQAPGLAPEVEGEFLDPKDEPGAGTLPGP